ncbi:MAG: S8 family serine peptidase, partial [Thermoguttaceae bacterium]|nr:S8 family serine peptidase [Thermoguttaceae bacterium]
MSISKIICRFCGIVTIAALLSVSLFAQDKPVPTAYNSYLDAVNAPYAWNLGYTGQNVVVGVIDDSVDMSHPFYSANIDTDSAYNTGVMYNNDFFKQNFMSNLPWQDRSNTSAVWDRATIRKDNASSNSVSEYDSHGTSVTGCIAAYNASSNTYGPAYDATIVPIRVDFPCQAFNVTLDGFSVGNYTFAQALVYNNDVIDIKNNSYGTSMGYISQDSSLTVAAINDAKANNTFLLYSAGNERNKTNYSNNKDCSKRVTNAHPYTITVAATGKDYTTDYTGFAPFSNYGACVFITAPGVGIRTSDREDVKTGNVFTYNATLVSESSYQGSVSGNMNSSFNGTSASCPVASGVLALALDVYKQAYPDQTCDVRYIKQLLARTST